MGILDHVTNTNKATGIRAVLSGGEKVGKTTLACSAPRPLLVPLEIGFAGQTVQKTPMLEHFVYVLQLLDEIIMNIQHNRFAYRTVIFDSGTALERLIHDAVLRRDPAYNHQNQKNPLTMESALGGYGKAYQYANELFAQFLNKCDQLAGFGINVVLTCHVFAARVVDPAHGEYDTWDLLLHSPKNQKTYGKREMLTQWADLIGFLYEPLYIAKGGDKSELNMGISANQGRILAVNRKPGHVAGNRFGVIADIPIPRDKGWNHLAHHIYQSSGFDFWNRD